MPTLTSLDQVEKLARALRDLKPNSSPQQYTHLYDALGYLELTGNSPTAECDRFDMKSIKASSEVTARTEVAKIADRQVEWQKLLFTALLTQQNFADSPPLTTRKGKREPATQQAKRLLQGTAEMLLTSEAARLQTDNTAPPFALYQLGLLFTEKASELVKIKDKKQKKKKGTTEPAANRKTYLEDVVTRLTAPDYAIDQRVKDALKNIWSDFVRASAAKNKKGDDRTQAFKSIGELFRQTAAFNGHLVAKFEMGLKLLNQSETENAGITLIASACQMIDAHKVNAVTTDTKLTNLYALGLGLLNKHGSPAAKLQLLMLENPTEIAAPDAAGDAGQAQRPRTKSAYAKPKHDPISDTLARQFFEKANSVDVRLAAFKALVDNFAQTVQQWEGQHRADAAALKTLSNRWGNILFSIIQLDNQDLLTRPAMVSHVSKLISLTHGETNRELSATFLEKLNAEATSPKKPGIKRQQTAKKGMPASREAVEATSKAAGEDYCELLVSHLTSSARLAELDAAKQLSARTLSLIAFTLSPDNIHKLTDSLVEAANAHYGPIFAALQAISSTANLGDSQKTEMDRFKNKLYHTLSGELGNISKSAELYVQFESIAKTQEWSQAKTLARVLSQTAVNALAKNIAPGLNEQLKTARADAIVEHAKNAIVAALGNNDAGQQQAVLDAMRQALIIANFESNNSGKFSENIRQAARTEIKKTFGIESDITKGPEYVAYKKAKPHIDTAINEALLALAITEKTGKKRLATSSKYKLKSVPTTDEIFASSAESVKENLSGSLKIAHTTMMDGFATHVDGINVILAGNQPDDDGSDPARETIYEQSTEALKNVRFQDAQELQGFLKAFLFNKGNTKAKFIGLAESLAKKLNAFDSVQFPDRLFWRQALLTIFLEHLDIFNFSDVMGPLARLVLTTEGSNLLATVEDAAKILSELSTTLKLPEHKNDVQALEMLTDLAHIKLYRGTQTASEDRKRKVQRYIAQIQQDVEGDAIEGVFEASTCDTIRSQFEKWKTASKTELEEKSNELNAARSALMSAKKPPEDFDASAGTYHATNKVIIEEAEQALKNARAAFDEASNRYELERDEIQVPVVIRVNEELALTETYAKNQRYLEDAVNYSTDQLQTTTLPLLANTSMEFPKNDAAENVVQAVIEALARDFDEETLKATANEEHPTYQFKLELKYDGSEHEVGSVIEQLRPLYIAYRQASTSTEAWRKYHRTDVDFSHSDKYVAAREAERMALNALKAPVRGIIYPNYDIKFVEEDFDNELPTSLSPELQEIITHFMLLDNPHLESKELSATQRNHELKRLYDSLDLSLKQGFFMRAALLNNSKQLYTLHERTANIVQADITSRLNGELPLSVNNVVMAGLERHLSTLGEDKASRFSAWFTAEIVVAHIRHIAQLNEALTKLPAFSKLATLADALKTKLINERLAPATLKWNGERIARAHAAFRERSRTTAALLAKQADHANGSEESDDDDEDDWDDDDETDDETDDEHGNLAETDATVEPTEPAAASAPPTDDEADDENTIDPARQAQLAAVLLAALEGTTGAAQRPPVDYRSTGGDSSEENRESDASLDAFGASIALGNNSLPDPASDPQAWIAGTLKQPYFTDETNYMSVITGYHDVIEDPDTLLWSVVQRALPKNYDAALTDQAAADKFLMVLNDYLQTQTGDAFNNSAALALATLVELAYWGHSSANELDPEAENYTRLAGFLTLGGVTTEAPSDNDEQFLVGSADAPGVVRLGDELAEETDDAAAGGNPPPLPAAPPPPSGPKPALTGDGDDNAAAQQPPLGQLSTSTAAQFSDGVASEARGGLLAAIRARGKRDDNSDAGVDPREVAPDMTSFGK